MTYAQIIYACLDEIKAISDDSSVTSEYVLFLAHKWRAALLNRTYKDIKKEIPTSNYQTICLHLEKTTEDSLCSETVLRSKEIIPTLLPIGNNQVYPINYYQGEITYISREKMKYVGYNKWLKNIIYASLAPDGHLYFKSNNPQYLYLEEVRFTGIFEDSEKADKLTCNDTNEECISLFEKEFPIEDALVTTLIELIVKEILGMAYRPADIVNNTTDDFNKPKPASAQENNK